MSVTREKFLDHVHRPLKSNAQPSSPTKSTYRVRWRELIEWDDFVSDALTYWGNLPDTQKTQVLPRVSHDYWDFVDVSLQDTALRRYSIHRLPRTAPGDSFHASLLRTPLIGLLLEQLMIMRESQHVDQPDVCFAFNNQLADIIELKSFWNLTKGTIVDVLQGHAP